MNPQTKPTKGTPGAAKSEKKNFFLGKCVVITGASSGIGRTLAFWYLNNGARVALVGRDIQELQNIGCEYPAQALVAKCDLTVDI